MISQVEGIQLIESEFPELTGLHNSNSAERNIHKSIRSLLDFSGEAVGNYNLNLSRKCFTLAKMLLTQGNALIRSAVEKSFIYAFAPFAKKDAYEKKRLKFFLPEDFYNIFLTRIEKPVTPEGLVENEKFTGIEDITFRPATSQDYIFAKQIADEMHSSALVRGCGISKRSPLSLIRKMIEGKAVIAVTSRNEWAGFSYIETYENDQFVSNSGLIVSPAYRQCGVAKVIKQQIFDLSRKLYPGAKIFSITTGAAVMKMNTRLGFEPVTYNEITKEKKFWEGCKSCVNYQTLSGKNFKNCLCTAMLFTPEEEPQDEENETETEHHTNL